MPKCRDWPVFVRYLWKICCASWQNLDENLGRY